MNDPRMKPSAWTRQNFSQPPTQLMSSANFNVAAGSQGMRLFYPLWEGAGARVYDAVPHFPYDGTSTTPASFGTINAATWAQGAFGGPCLQFTTTANVDFGGPNVGGDTQGTILAWIYPTSFSTSGSIFAFGATNIVLALFLGTNGSIRFQWDNNTINDAVATAASTLSLNQWAQIAVTGDGSTWTLYKNAIPLSVSVLAGSNSGRWFGGSPNFTHPSRMRLGYDGQFYQYNGRIDHVRVFSRALSRSELFQLYSKPFMDFERSRPALSGLAPGGGAIPDFKGRWFLP